MKESLIMRKTETYFEQIPVQQVKDIMVRLPESQGVRPQVSRSPRNVLRCTICRQPVPVETAKTDSNGRAIHEECYMISVTGKTATPRTRSISRV
jgi:hypothetical protein